MLSVVRGVRDIAVLCVLVVLACRADCADRVVRLCLLIVQTVWADCAGVQQCATDCSVGRLCRVFG